MGPDGPKWDLEDFFLLIQTLPTFWATWILILRIFTFEFFLDLKFPDVQFPDFQISRNLGWALAWARAWPGLGRLWLEVAGCVSDPLGDLSTFHSCLRSK